jgi:hypothetical protein
MGKHFGLEAAICAHRNQYRLRLVEVLGDRESRFPTFPGKHRWEWNKSFFDAKAQ